MMQSNESNIIQAQSGSTCPLESSDDIIVGETQEQNRGTRVASEKHQNRKHQQAGSHTSYASETLRGIQLLPELRHSFGAAVPLRICQTPMTRQIKLTLKRIGILVGYKIVEINGAVTVFSAGNKEHFVGDNVDLLTAKDLAKHYIITTKP